MCFRSNSWSPGCQFSWLEPLTLPKMRSVYAIIVTCLESVDVFTYIANLFILQASSEHRPQSQSLFTRVPFQEESDNIKNFPNMKVFHAFKKQRYTCTHSRDHVIIVEAFFLTQGRILLHFTRLGDSSQLTKLELPVCTARQDQVYLMHTCIASVLSLPPHTLVIYTV